VVLLKSVIGNSFASLYFYRLLGEINFREIVRYFCNSFWNCLKATENPEKTEDDWVNIANDFYRRTQFPHCIGAVDGKHVRITMLTGSGSLFYYYKHFFLILFLALVDANYCFIVVDFGPVEKNSDSIVFKDSNIGRKLESNQLGIPRQAIV